MSLSSPSIAFFQSNELIKEAEVLVVVAVGVVEDVFCVEEGMAQQLPDSPFPI